MALISSNFELKCALWNVLNFITSKGFKALESWLKFWPTRLLLCWGKDNFKETKEKMCVHIPMILPNIALVFFTTLDCKLYQKFKND